MNQALGKCYSRAYDISQKLKINLVHGIITNPSGKVITHAWNEYEKFGIWFVYDFSDPNLKPIHKPRTDYYVAYKIGHATRYNHFQAWQLLDRSDYYGPWDLHALELDYSNDVDMIKRMARVSKVAAKFMETKLNALKGL